MDYKNGFVLSAVVFAFLAILISTPTFAFTCGVNVYGLNIEGDKIVGYVQNSGTGLELISYAFYVNGEEVRTGSFELRMSQTRRIEHTYSFGHGEYTIELWAEAGCNANDSETIVHNILEPYMCQNPSGFEGQDYCDYTNTRYMVCDDGQWIVVDVNGGEYCYNCNVCGDGMCNCGETASTCWADCRNICSPEYLDTYRCNGDWRQRLYRNSDCEYEWKDWELCADCVDGYCVDGYECTPGWKCRDYYHRAYQNSDCTWSSSTYCQDGCSNGYCIGDGCTPGWRCKDSYNKAYQNSDCSWSSITYCSNRCENGYCRGEYGTCSVSIEDFDYITEVSEGSPAWVKFTLKNTGTRKETIRAKLYIDGSYWGSEKVELYSGSKITKSFNFYLLEGSHNVRVEAVAECGYTDTRNVIINIRGTGTQPPQACNYNGVCEYGESRQTCPHDCPEPEPTPTYITSVDVHPTSLDIENCATGTVSIDITSSKKQTFTIDVSGVSEEWLSYPGSLEVDVGDKRVYLYITPKEPGTYILDLSVKAESEGKEFTETVEFYVSPTQEAGTGMTGFLTAVSANLVAVIIGIIIVIAIILYIGFKRIRPEEEFSELEPAEPKTF